MSIKRGLTLLIIALILPLTSCEALLGYQIYKWATEDDKGGGAPAVDNYSPETPAVEATETYAIALGGVAPGRDELILTDSNDTILNLGGDELRFEVDSSVVGLLPRPDFDDFSSGSGAKIIPQETGFAVITYYIDDILQDDQFLVIVPPQSLIQIMIAEASTQLTEEAETGADYHVKLTSSSPTADGIGSVTRNRIVLISGDLNYSLFNVDEFAWLLEPDASYYDSVITATNGGIYQYSPVDPDDPTNLTFEDAEARNFLDSSLHRAYDQAVLSAAYIYSGDTKDSTGSAFGFFSPTKDEWERIEDSYDASLFELLNGCGMDDDNFPALAPIQIVILEDVWTYEDGRPAFVFIRQKGETDYAVVYE